MSLGMNELNISIKGVKKKVTLYLSTMGNRIGPSLDLLKFGKLSRCGMNGKPLQKQIGTHVAVGGTWENDKGGFISVHI